MMRSTVSVCAIFTPGVRKLMDGIISCAQIFVIIMVSEIVEFGHCFCSFTYANRFFGVHFEAKLL